MFDISSDLPAIIDDCGEAASTEGGAIVGRLVEESVLIELDSGQSVEGSETVFYTDQAAIDAVALIKGARLSLGAQTWYVRTVPRPDTAGLVRVVLSR